MRITLKDGTHREVYISPWGRKNSGSEANRAPQDIGYGSADNLKLKSQVYEKAKKQAVTDAIKRTLRTFGNALGNCLYDKSHVRRAMKMKAPEVFPLRLGLVVFGCLFIRM